MEYDVDQKDPQNDTICSRRQEEDEGTSPHPSYGDGEDKGDHTPTKTIADGDQTVNGSDILNSTSPIPIKILDPRIGKPQITPPGSPNNNKTDDVPPRKYRLLYEDMRARFNELKKDCDNQLLEHEKSIAEKDKTILELKTRLQKKDENTVPKVMKMKNIDIFVTKPRKGAKDASSNECAISGCENSNVDLIKCCMCRKLVCEDCSKVKVAKLRPLMNTCDTLYFTCDGCTLLIKDENDINVYDVLQGKVKTLTEELDAEERKNAKLINQAKTMKDQQSSLQLILEERENTLQETETKLVNLEQNAAEIVIPATGGPNLEELISNRLDKIDQNIDALITKKLAGILPTSSSTSNENAPKLFSAVVGPGSTTESHMAAMKTTRNAEILEKQEQEKRANNIIIYGVSEERTDPNLTIKEHDQRFINDLFTAIEVNVVPKQTVRLGNEVQGQKRPVKVVLSSPEDKAQIMSSLRKLKNADAPLRSISVRDDYTIEERQLIKSMQEEAKRRNEAENVTYWKVRGTPKNGLKVVKITTRN